MSDAPSAPAGWFQDPEDAAQLRYWDGSAWTDHRVVRQVTASPRAEVEVDPRPIAVPALLIAGALLVTAGLARTISYLTPYDAFAVALAFSALEVLAWVGAFVGFLAAGYPSRRRTARALTLVLVGLSGLGGIINLGIAMNPFGSQGWLTLSGLIGLVTLGVGIAFAVSALRTPGLTRRLGALPLVLYLGLIAFGLIAGVVGAAALSAGPVATTISIVITAASGLGPAVVGALFLAFGRRPHVPAA